MSRPGALRRPAGGSWQVVMMAKAPLAGRVKTRLCPPLSFAEAATLAAAAIDDTLAAMMGCGARRRVVALDGTGWEAPAGVDLVPQRPGPFGERLAGAVADTWAGAALPVVVIGMDTPQLTAPLLDDTAAALASHDTVLGPASDGGYWVIGSRRPVPGMFDGVPMSTAGTGRAQRCRLQALGLSVATVGELRDVDEYEDAVAVAGQAPHTRFADVLATLGPRLGTGHRLAASSGPVRR